jgi:rare lipoprotein A
MTAARRTLPLGTKVRVTNVENGQSVIVRISDRGPQHTSRIIDLSRAAADALGFRANGYSTGEVGRALILNE